MPLPKLTEEIAFPNTCNADKDGLLAYGGDLSVNRLLFAYKHGIFPWYSKGTPILWWSPNPRCILIPKEFRLSKSLKRICKSGKFTVKVDSCFDEIISACQKTVRDSDPGTWITAEMKTAYIALFNEGYAHSIEVFHGDNLVGGLYGLAIGKVFFGESMFHKLSNASKVAAFYLTELLKLKGFDLIDSQVETEHLISLGAKMVSRKVFEDLLNTGIEKDSDIGTWEIHPPLSALIANVEK